MPCRRRHKEKIETQLLRIFFSAKHHTIKDNNIYPTSQPEMQKLMTKGVESPQTVVDDTFWAAINIISPTLLTYQPPLCRF
jgi:hypothetical protein